MASTENLVHLDLDALDRESVEGLPKAKSNPYFVTAGGQRYAFRDAVELNHILLAQMEQTPTRFFSAAIEEPSGAAEGERPNFKAFMKWANEGGKDGTAGLNGIKLRAVMKGYREYYGLDDQGNA